MNNQARQENGMDMNHLDRVRAAAYRAAIFIGTGGQGRERRRERGDVPGWVLINFCTIHAASASDMNCFHGGIGVPGRP